MDESFTLDDVEQSEIEQAAQVPNSDNITVCSCRGICMRESGRNACPCKGINQYCSSACHPQDSACMNTQRVLEGDTSHSSDSDFLEEQTVSFVIDVDYRRIRLLCCTV